ncbi:hypothetical protein AVEN_190286-1 [Araneus ventricosus]|uniref:Uncharacterized protein n=1 Tax=Araneus ventricosus TaxID=182803 RepID=A0A4Y2JH33_ARAVE|nr:hypothetical protein AVEN_190286-1 [Araneus ventricosus]
MANSALLAWKIESHMGDKFLPERQLKCTQNDQTGKGLCHCKMKLSLKPEGQAELQPTLCVPSRNARPSKQSHRGVNTANEDVNI